MQGGRTLDRPAYPDVEARIGTNPARFLVFDGDVVGGRHEIGGDGLLLARARIKGIDDFETIAGWRQVATDLHDRDLLGDDAYQIVMDDIGDRADWLRDHGTREERMERQGRREIDQDLVDRSNDSDGEQLTAIERLRRERDDKTKKSKGRRTAVTDGGDRDV